MNNVREQLEEVQEQLQVLHDWEPLTLYKVTENFAKFGERTYYVCNVTMEIEDNMVSFSDAEQLMLIDNTRGANIFLISSVKSASCNCVDRNGKLEYHIEFADGTIDMVSKIVRSSLCQYETQNNTVLELDEEAREMEEIYRKYYADNE